MMSRPTHLPSSLNNHDHGLQNANTGEGPQNNNNSTGSQYNLGSHSKVIFSNQDGNPKPQQDQERIDDSILESLAFPRMLDRKENIERCHTNTCQWILDLEKYKFWRSQSHGLLWIKGKPGAGKSTLMAFLYEDLKEQLKGTWGNSFNFFFTARGTKMQRTPLGMFRSLLNQIFLYVPSVRPLVREAYLQRCRQFGSRAHQWEWPQMVLEDLVADVILKSDIQQHVTVFVDALDEAGAESAQQLAEYFHKLHDRAEKEGVAVKICISCRHYPIVSSPRAVEITVEYHNHGDIETYIKDKILAGLVIEDAPDQREWQDLIHDLIQQANGMFQWARIIMPHIRRKVDEKESPKDIRRWLCQVPADLEDLYRYILDHVIEQENRSQSFFFFSVGVPR